MRPELLHVGLQKVNFWGSRSLRKFLHHCTAISSSIIGCAMCCRSSKCTTLLAVASSTWVGRALCADDHGYEGQDRQHRQGTKCESGHEIRFLK